MWLVKSQGTIRAGVGVTETFFLERLHSLELFSWSRHTLSWFRKNEKSHGTFSWNHKSIWEIKRTDLESKKGCPASTMAFRSTTSSQKCEWRLDVDCIHGMRILLHALATIAMCRASFRSPSELSRRSRSCTFRGESMPSNSSCDSCVSLLWPLK